MWVDVPGIAPRVAKVVGIVKEEMELGEGDRYAEIR